MITLPERNNFLIASSLLSADFARLGQEVKALEEAGADWLHFDVMDGRFVPNISIGIPVLESLRKVTRLPIDVHLMVTDPKKWIEPFAKAGADDITFHIEAEPDPRELLSCIHSFGMKAGIVLNPGTPPEAAKPFLEYCDLILLMTVNPGFGGQGFIFDVVKKIQTLNDWIKEMDIPCELEVDGGVNPETAALCRDAGASVLVAGSSIFRAASQKEMISALRG